MFYTLRYISFSGYNIITDVIKRGDSMSEKTYIAIDLKSYYASVECMERGLDPLTTNLVVADASRTDKTICLAVSPSLKAMGIKGRPRLFEVIQKVKEINYERKIRLRSNELIGSSYDANKLMEDPALAVDYIVAPPRMSYYIKQSAYIYDIYMQFVSPDDIHVYSIDEVFIDVTPYLKTAGMTAREFSMKIIQQVLQKTGITATVGIGTNLYLAKVAMDIGAKHIQPDENGVRIAELDEISYRRQLWEHRPLTDFWRVGRGYAKKLEEHGMFTMGDIARCSIGKDTDFHNEELLYKLFGINAELLIDHAWGWEPCTIADIKAYKPENNSMGSGQVLHCPYSNEKAKIVLMEMADQLSLDLVEKGFVTDQLVLTIGYDRENLNDTEKIRSYTGKIKMDHYGRAVPQHAQGTISLIKYTSSSKKIINAAIKLFDDITDEKLLIRRINIAANHVIAEGDIPQKNFGEQMDLFTDYTAKKKAEEKETAEDEKEKKLQQAMLSIKQKFGKNAILKGISLEEGATAKDRNNQIGGHKA